MAGAQEAAKLLQGALSLGARHGLENASKNAGYNPAQRICSS